ncbi:hypothetical protein AHAS_Ahas15G0093600 [Arachis hypogaea]
MCVICLADYREREVLLIMPKCDHTFHLSCIDIWLRKQSTCPVCCLPLKNSSDANHVRTVTYTMSQPFDELQKNQPLLMLLLIPMLVQRVGGCNTRTDF